MIGALTPGACTIPCACDLRRRHAPLLGHLNATWSAWLERYAGFIGVSFRERLETVFKELGARFGVDDKRGTLIILELSQEDLAEMIGSSRPMVSKLLVDMVEEGLLARAEQHRFILLRQDERQSKLGRSVTGRPVGDEPFFRSPQCLTIILRLDPRHRLPRGTRPLACLQPGLPGI